MAHAFDPENPNPLWTLAGPLLACAFLGGIFAGLPTASGLMIAAAALLLGISVFAAVHHAEIIALKVGEPFGSIVLAVAVTTIEVALIVSIMMSAADGAPEMARDAVFASIMIVLGGIVGFSLIMGGAKHHEQRFELRGATAALSVLGTLSAIVFILPTYAMGAPGPVFTNRQLIFVGVLSLLLYAVFIFIQTVRHRDYFQQKKSDDDEGPHEKPSFNTTITSLVLLLVALVAVVALAKVLSPAIDAGMTAWGLPATFLGVIIAGIVLLPESLAAVSAARADRIQTSINLALGSAIACIGLTIPTVAIVSLTIGQKLTLGITPDQTVLLVLALFVSSLTLGSTGKTTVLHGAVHLVILGVYLFLAAGLG